MSGEAAKRVLLAPLDPVHDVGLKVIRRALEAAGHTTILLPPDVPPEEIVAAALEHQVDVVLLSRTIGYQVAEAAARFADLAEAAGLRERVRIAIGGMAIRPELAAEMGFDAAFGPGTTPEEAVAFVEGREPAPGEQRGATRRRPALAPTRTYRYRHAEIGRLLEEIAQELLAWAHGRLSPGVERAQLRQAMIRAARAGESTERLRREYARLTDGAAAAFYARGDLPPGLRRLEAGELQAIRRYAERANAAPAGPELRHGQDTLVFTQYGTGCPIHDIAHIKVLEGWSVDGVIHFDPAWGARTEGLLEGAFTHQRDGTVITPENLQHIRAGLGPYTLWQVRAHRGLNTAETVVLAGEYGADATKINIAYGSLSGGTDPERLAVDGLAAMRYAAEYRLPYDVVTNEELSGVPAHKAFAGMLIVAHVGRRLGGTPYLQPLFCKGPEALIRGLMDANHVDFHAAKILALRRIVDAPIWPGAPVGFMTHTEDRVQSSVTTALHAALGASLGVEAVTIASSDEAYSGGPITAASRVDTLRAVAEALRFFGRARIEPTPAAESLADELVEGIEQVLRRVAEVGFVRALYEGVLGSPEEGGHPGRAGRGTVYARAAR
ncbi:cobalamin-dependent protein [Caldinitratiruptor microaerophilus]|uniref:B12-binding domain-containing protein n=1 Tax=Caldinitratiruptor microaerophilus TaxID=671077 RepID=A0AA35CK84_9FIRM|nr:cobalamin-dependent protein [Caldinitratiruptor microaerophilus]BDG59037.1 hypothetical protein caldi_01270 [Caldinitratiruptor microaerophilus]